MFHPVLLAALIHSALAHDKARFDIGEDAHRILQDALQHNDELRPEERAVLLSSFPPGALDQMEANLSSLRDSANRLSGLLRDKDKVKSHVPAEVLGEDATLPGVCVSTAGVSQLQDTTPSRLAVLATTIVHKYESLYLLALKENDVLSTSAGNHNARNQTWRYSLVSLSFIHEAFWKAIHASEAQFTALEQHNSSRAMSLSIIRSIPSEIILHIFAFLHVDKLSFPLEHERPHRRWHHGRWDGRLVVGYVCRKWRELVNGHSALWRDITFPPLFLFYPAEAEHGHAYQLSRVRYGHINATVPMYNRLLPLGELFLSWAPRVAILKCEDQFDTRFLGSWLFHLPKTLPLLRSVELIIHDTRYLELFDRITAFMHAPLLQTFTSILFFSGYYIEPNPSIPLPYANLVEFNTAWYFNCGQTTVSFPDFFLRPLYKGTRLETYRQWGCELNCAPSVEGASGRRRQDSLVKLVTCSITILNAIYCPSLETLSVGNIEGDGTYQVPGRRKFHGRATQNATSLIQSTAAFLSASHCTLSSLELTSVTFNHIFIRILRSIPSLETLNATATAFSAEEDDTIFKFFSLLRRKRHDEFSFLPKLMSLSFTVNLCEKNPRWRRDHNIFHFAGTPLFNALIARSNVFQAFSLIIQGRQPFWALGYEREMMLRELECVKDLRCEDIDCPQWANRSV